MKEEWKTIAGTNGRYEVSNTGKVRCMDYRNRGEIREIKQRPNPEKRMLVTLFVNGKRRDYTVHRLVAKTFIPNPDNLPQINHIDGNPQNNNVDNLEWCDAFHNMQHAYRNGLMENARKAAKVTGKALAEKAKEKRIPITAIHMKTAEIKYFPGINVAAIETGASCPAILKVLKGGSHTANGYVFVYGNNIAKDEAQKIIANTEKAIAFGFKKQTESIIARRGKAVKVFFPDGNVMICETIIDAERRSGVKRASIRAFAEGCQKKKPKGYAFEYVKEGDAHDYPKTDHHKTAAQAGRIPVQSS